MSQPEQEKEKDFTRVDGSKVTPRPRATASENEPTPTGRRRCRIPEHRKQIKAMQRWCVYLQTAQGQSWQRQRVIELERDVLQRRIYELQAQARSRIGGWALVAILAGFVLGVMAGFFNALPAPP